MFNQISTIAGLMNCVPSTKRGESRDNFGISKNSRKKNLLEHGVARLKDRKK